VYWGNQAVQDRLGEPNALVTSIDASRQEFQQGSMFLRGDTGLIYVVRRAGTWDSYPDPGGPYPPTQPGPEPDTWIPGGAFGALWQAEPSVSADLGYALSDGAIAYLAEAQSFEGGFMLLSPNNVYVFYNDGTWEYYPAAQ
jgi:hypothetical protein